MTQVSRATWASDLSDRVDSNGAGGVTALDVRNVFTDLVDSIPWHDEAAQTVNGKTGDDITLDADDLGDGAIRVMMTQVERTKLDGIETGATADMTNAEIVAAVSAELGGTAWQSGGSGSTDLGWNPATGTVTSSSGNNAVLTAADASNPGLMPSGDKTKLDGIEAGATAELTDGDKGLFTWSGGAATFTADAPITNPHVQTRLYTKTGDFTFELGMGTATVRVNSGSAIVATIPVEASAAFPNRTQIALRQVGAGQVTLSATAGVALNGVNGGSTVLEGAYKEVVLQKVGADDWEVIGAHGGVS